MKGDRHRIPIDGDYLKAIGTAVYCFATLEWNAVYCGEKLSPGYVGKLAKKTAGKIATDVAKFESLISDPNKRARYRTATSEFVRLAKSRNDLLHSNSATVGHEQRLVRQGKPWQANEIDDLADEFAACSIELNELYHKVL